MKQVKPNNLRKNIALALQLAMVAAVISQSVTPVLAQLGGQAGAPSGGVQQPNQFTLPPLNSTTTPTDGHTGSSTGIGTAAGDGHTGAGSAIDNAANNPCTSPTPTPIPTGHGSTVNDNSTGTGTNTGTTDTGHTSIIGDSATGTTTSDGHTATTGSLDNVTGGTGINCNPSATSGGPGTGNTSQASSSATTATTPTPTPTPIAYEVPDCPGVKRMINASHLPPSIYPKVGACGATAGATGSTPGLGTSTGKYGTGTDQPGAGTLWKVITGNKDYPINQGFGMTDFAAGAGASMYGYCTDYGVPGHCGVDLGTDIGVPTYSPVAGKVVCIGTDNGDGGTDGGCAAFPFTLGAAGPTSGRFEVQLDNGDHLIFGHMSRIDVALGTQLQAGQYVGLSGGMNGPHIHVEYRQINHPETSSGQKTLDPRDIFDVPAGSVKPFGGPTALANSSNLALANSAQPAVLATTALATTMPEFEQKYGFDAPSGKSGLDFSGDAANFATERDFAIKYAPIWNLEPQMVVWWTWAETSAPHDSWHYNNCLNQSPYPLDVSCGSTASGNWQIGYGQQYSMSVDSNLFTKAWKDTHGNDDATAVQQAGQLVLDKAGVKMTFPSMTVAQLAADEGSNRFWIFTLSRDQAMSVYLTAAEIRGDLDGRPGMTYRDITAQWGSYYQTHWQDYSNVMNDVLVNWGVAASSGASVACTSTPANTTQSSCSTIPDKFNGSATVDEFTKKLNDDMPVLKAAETCSGAPWQLLAAISYMESGLNLKIHNPWNFSPDPSWSDDTAKAACEAGKQLQTSAMAGPMKKALTANMDPSVHDNEVMLKDAMWAWQGRIDFSGPPADNKSIGCTPDLEGHSDWDWDCSGFVMNNWDTQHQNMKAYQLDAQGKPAGLFSYTYDAAWKIYYKLFNSTLDANGQILVYGGKCLTNNQAENGIALPTKPNLNINSQFFGGTPPHIGIDIANAEGDPVFAMTDGDIVTSGWIDVGGYYILQHVPAKTAGNNNERWIYYGHLDPNGLPAAGSQVKAGQQIAKTGPHMVQNPSGQTVTNGIQSGPHLHFDIRTEANEAQDPSGHVNPCSISQFKTGYPTLDCSATQAALGQPWQ